MAIIFSKMTVIVKFAEVFTSLKLPVLQYVVSGRFARQSVGTGGLCATGSGVLLFGPQSAKTYLRCDAKF